jgi:HEAT repeats
MERESPDARHASGGSLSSSLFLLPARFWDSGAMAGQPIASVTPRVRIASECARRGREAVLADCLALLRGDTDLGRLTSVVGPESLAKYTDGREHDDTYWFRVWALRALLWSWDDSATDAVCAALTDEAWRAREMAAKVVARHLVSPALPILTELRDDPVPRVRAAAERALVALTAAGA